MNRLEFIQYVLWFLLLLSPALFAYGVIKFIEWSRGELHGDQRK